MSQQLNQVKDTATDSKYFMLQVSKKDYSIILEKNSKHLLSIGLDIRPWQKSVKNKATIISQTADINVNICIKCVTM